MELTACMRSVMADAICEQDNTLSGAPDLSGPATPIRRPRTGGDRLRYRRVERVRLFGEFQTVAQEHRGGSDQPTGFAASRPERSGAEP